ncbi:MAG: hypothetical protein WDN25_08735 [Acetobacteraceae bacterium]
MGLGRDLLHEIIRLRREKILGGRPNVIEIGAQQLSNDFLRADDELKEVFALFERPPMPALAAPVDAGHVAGLELQPKDAPGSQPFWEALGFAYSALDFDGHRHSYPLDLNRDVVTDELRNRFDLVVNAGTTEHVANQDNAFKVIHDLTRTGGVMIHDVPASGMMTHGLITYTMKFFWHLCRENDYQVLRLEMAPGGAAVLPDNIVGTNREFGQRHGSIHFEDEPIRDWTIAATLRKTTGKAFVTPMDLPVELMAQRPRPGMVTRGVHRVLSRLRRI